MTNPLSNPVCQKLKMGTEALMGSKSADTNSKTADLVSESINFERCLQESPVVFFIGPEQTKFHIHPSIVKDVSEPLYKLMTNGTLEESITGVAKLPEVLPSTFANFCGYAYARNYRAQGTELLRSQNTAGCQAGPSFEGYRCWRCGSTLGNKSLRYEVPFCNENCKSLAEVASSTALRYCVICGSSLTPWKAVDNFYLKSSAVCTSCSKTPRWKSFARPAPEPFTDVEIGVAEMTSTEIAQVLNSKLVADQAVDNVIAHARLWVFADMYLATTLKQLCLHKLRRDLYVLPLTDANIKKLIELTKYTYANDSTATQPDLPTVSPRALLRVFFVERREILLKSDDFKELLNAGGPMVVDMMEEMGKFVQGLLLL